MIEDVVRDCVRVDRLAKGLSEYYYRRARGARCPDLLAPEERAERASAYERRLAEAQAFMRQSPWGARMPVSGRPTPATLRAG